jgi:hypothetical protein
MRGAPAGKGPLWGSLGVVPSISGSVSAAVHKALYALLALLTRTDCDSEDPVTPVEPSVRYTPKLKA